MENKLDINKTDKKFTYHKLKPLMVRDVDSCFSVDFYMKLFISHRHSLDIWKICDKKFIYMDKYYDESSNEFYRQFVVTDNPNKDKVSKDYFCLYRWIHVIGDNFQTKELEIYFTDFNKDELEYENKGYITFSRTKKVYTPRNIHNNINIDLWRNEGYISTCEIMNYECILNVPTYIDKIMRSRRQDICEAQINKNEIINDLVNIIKRERSQRDLYKLGNKHPCIKMLLRNDIKIEDLEKDAKIYEKEVKNMPYT